MVGFVEKKQSVNTRGLTIRALMVFDENTGGTFFLIVKNMEGNI